MADVTILLVEAAVRLSPAHQRALAAPPFRLVHATHEDVATALATHAPQVVVLTTRGMAHQVAALMAQIQQQQRATRVIIVAQRPTVRGATAALRAGASDYIKLHGTTRALIQAIHQALPADAMAATTPPAKDDLISLVSHELRSPLMAVNGYLEILQRYHDKISTEKAQDYIKRSLQATGELAYLSDLLVQVMRHEAGHALVALEAVPLAPIIQAAISQCELQASRHTISCDIAPDLVIYADALAMQQISRNLVSNAIKYSPQGGAITVSGQITPDGMAQIAVRDEGMGIAPERLPQLFGRYARLHDVARWPDIRGTGLGLYICHQLAQAHGGRIWAESTLGQGSTFFVQVPLVSEPKRAIEAAPGRPTPQLPPVWIAARQPPHGI